MALRSGPSAGRAGPGLALSGGPAASLASSMESRVVRSRHRRAMRLVAVFVLGAAIPGGCRVDDRVLTGPDTGSSGGGGGGSDSCGIATDNVCGQCLYAECCDEAR